MNILDLITADGVKLKKYGATYRGRCPFHSGKTEMSLLVDADAGKYHCFGCDMHGDEIQWLRDRRGLSFIEACEYLGHDPGPRPSGPRPAPPAWGPREATTPTAIWQVKARSFLDGAIETLWSERGAKMRAWLRTEKGLHDATIKEACLGLALADKYEQRPTWGLEPVIKEDGTEKMQWIPAGLVIPWVVNGDVHRLRIRRNDPGDGPRYVIVSGSGTAPAAWSLERAAAVIVESELDGLLLNQEAGDLCAVVALGSAQARPDTRTDALLKSAKTILISLDSDEVGAKAAWDFWPKQYGKKVKRWPCLKGKDPSEAWKNGLDLRQWIQAGLPDIETDQAIIPPLENESLIINPDAPESSLQCEEEPPPPPDTLNGTGLHKLINGDQFYDFADGRATKLFMAKGNFAREYQGRTVQINQMDYLTMPADEIKTMLQSGLIKADRDVTPQGPTAVRQYRATSAVEIGRGIGAH
jgi:hypothetical protein